MNLPPFNNADEILPNLWLGNFNSAKDENFLRNANIKTVFNCTKDLPFHHSIKRQYRVPIDDNLQAVEIRNLELWSLDFMIKLHKEYQNGKNPILVHCAAGMQRSAAGVAMFLIATKPDMTSEQACQFIKNKRPIAFTPSANFARSIVGFEEIIRKMYVQKQMDHMYFS